VNLIESHFPNYPLPREIQATLGRTEDILHLIQGWGGDPIPVAEIADELSKEDLNYPSLLKQILYLYRRWRAADTERYTEKTFHLELAETLEQDVKALDAVVNEEWFQKIEPLRLPRLKDFLPVQYIEAAIGNLAPFPARQHDEKFHILQAPNLFLPDLAYFRAQCEDRDTLLAIAFLDIDDFKSLNTKHTETKVDRNLLPRFMQTIEAHVFHHGYAYRQGGDEYLILIPSLSKPLAIAFLDELRCKLATLKYPDIEGKTTVSIGLCIVEPDCPLTDRELRDRASQAKQFAKKNGKNRIATVEEPHFVAKELEVVSSRTS
jgi:diguanylate cyclase (GGDEF)-like protein